MHAGWSTPQIPFNAGFDAWFEHGFLRFDGRNDPPLQVFDDPTQVNGHPAEYERGDAYYDEIAYFMHCVETGAALDECPPRSARNSLRLIDLEIEAVESGQVVSGKE